MDERRVGHAMRRRLGAPTNHLGSALAKNNDDDDDGYPNSEAAQRSYYLGRE